MSTKNNPNTRRESTRNLVRLSAEQEELLETAFGITQNLSDYGVRNLIRFTGLVSHQIQYWFHHRRLAIHLSSVPHAESPFLTPRLATPNTKPNDLKSLKENIKKIQRKHAKTLDYHSAEVRNFQKKLNYYYQMGQEAELQRAKDNEAIQDMVSEISHLTHLVNHLDASLEQSQTTVDNLKSQNRALNLENQQTQCRMREIEGNLSAMENETRVLRSQLDDKEAELRELRKKEAEPGLEQLTRINNTQVKDLLTDLKNRDAQIANLEAVLAFYKNPNGAELNVETNALEAEPDEDALLEAIIQEMDDEGKGAEPMTPEEKYTKMLEGRVTALQASLTESERKGAELEQDYSTLLEWRSAELQVNTMEANHKEAELNAKWEELQGLREPKKEDKMHERLWAENRRSWFECFRNEAREDFKGSSAALKAHIKELEAELTRKWAEIRSKEKMVEEAELCEKEAEQTIQVTVQESNTLNDYISHLETQLERKGAELREKEAELEEFKDREEEKIQMTVQESNTLNNYISHLETELERKGAELQRKGEELQHKSRKISMLTDKVLVLNLEESGMNTCISGYKQKTKMLEAELNEKGAELAKATTRIQKQNRRLVTMVRELEDVRKQHLETVETLEAELEELREKLLLADTVVVSDEDSDGSLEILDDEL